MVRLAIDIDGILARFVEGFARILNDIHPGAIPLGYQPSSWNAFVEESLDVTPDEYRGAWGKVRDTPSFWLRLDAYRDNVLDLREYLTKSSAPWSREVYFLTSRFATGGESAQYQTCAWLRGQGIPNANVIVVDRMEDKTLIAVTLKFSAIIDDNLETVYDLRNAGVNAYLLDQPWNRVTTDFEDYRVPSLRGFLKREGG
jgi:uncharacterized HAD superfamily protein